MAVRSFLFIGVFIAAAAGIAEAQAETPVDFRESVERRLANGDDENAIVAGKAALLEVCPIDSNPVARRVFKDYGAMFLAVPEVTFPTKCIFDSEEEVLNFQKMAESESAEIGGKMVTLQKAAMESLKSAVAAAAAKKLSISPRGSSASRRDYADTLRIWKSRFNPALNHWVSKQKISAAEAEKARTMATREQVERVMEWEAEGLWFSTNFDRSIFSSVAAPGTSQHLTMIALDVSEFADKNVREILNSNGWFQTIIDDTPHFTYLGLKEDELPSRGLRSEWRGGTKFWIPNFK